MITITNYSSLIERRIICPIYYETTRILLEKARVAGNIVGNDNVRNYMYMVSIREAMRTIDISYAYLTSACT